MKLKITECKEWVLYHKYPHQFNTQPVYLYLDLETGEAYCDWNAEINAVSVDIYHNRVLHWKLPEAIFGEVANVLMYDCNVWLQTILDNSSIIWNGNNNVGVLTEEAKDAEDNIREYIQDHHPESLCAEVYYVEDWLQHVEIKEDYKQGMSVEEIAEQQINIAQSENILLIGDAVEYIKSIID